MVLDQRTFSTKDTATGIRGWSLLSGGRGATGPGQSPHLSNSVPESANATNTPPRALRCPQVRSAARALQATADTGRRPQTPANPVAAVSCAGLWTHFSSTSRTESQVPRREQPLSTPDVAQKQKEKHFLHLKCTMPFDPLPPTTHYSGERPCSCTDGPGRPGAACCCLNAPGQTGWQRPSDLARDSLWAKPPSGALG